MARAAVNGIELEYETFGDEGARPLLLIMGLGAQMVLWDEVFCEMLVDRGHFVVRYDNRDVGLSTKFESAGVPKVMQLMAAAAAGETLDVPYRLADMADDAAGLLDHLGVDAAHVVGASMGGMIAQQVASSHRARVRSLTSIMSSTGRPDLPRARPEAMARLTTPAPTEREAYGDHSVEGARVMSGKGFPVDAERVRARALRQYDRCFHPPGMARQLAAIVSSPPRNEALRALDVPALVIHGQDDPLVPVEGGLDTHESLRGSELLLIEGMGHDLPPAVYARIADAISKLTERVA